MIHRTRSSSIVIFALGALAAPSLAGDLIPPAGPIAPTEKPLTDVEPRTAINADNTPGDASASFVISQPGSYYLTGNIDADAAKAAIHVSSDNVTLDLNGFTIDGTGSAGAPAISITDAYIGIVISAGHIVDWPLEAIIGEDASELEIRNVRFAGIASDAILVGRAHIRDCRFHGCISAVSTFSHSIYERCLVTDSAGTALAGGNRSVIRDCRVINAGNNAIQVSGSDAVVEGNVISGSATSGIRVGTGAGNTVRDNRVTGCAVGLHVTSAGNTVAANLVDGNSDNYDFVAGNQLDLILSEIPESIDWPARLTLSGDLVGVAAQDGLTLASDDVTIDLDGHALIGVPGSLNGIIDSGNPGGITVRNGTVRDWGARGIDFSGTSGCEFVNVAFTSNTGSGLSSGSSATIQSCSARDNAIFGFIVGNNCVVSDCTASGNGAQGINTGLGCSVSHCTAYLNGQQGIQTAFGSSIAHCASNNNTLNGIVTSPGCTIVDCSALDNAIYGISAGQGSIVDRCISGRNGSGGIRVSDGCIIRNNTCFDHPTGSGIDVFAGNDNARIEANHCYLNNIGVDCQATGCFIAQNTCSANTTNWDVAAGNICLVVQATPTGAAFSGDFGGTSPGSADPNANFSH